MLLFCSFLLWNLFADDCRLLFQTAGCGAGFPLSSSDRGNDCYASGTFVLAADFIEQGQDWPNVIA